MEAEPLIFRDAIRNISQTNYSTHNFFSYPARFIPQIPLYFIREYMHNHHALLDNFAGCGTSLVEAKIAGYDSYGIELNPLGRLLTEVKTTPLDISLLEESKDKLDKLLSKTLEPAIPEFSTRDFWFDKKTQEQLGRLKAAIDKTHNEKVRKFFLVCFASIIRKCSNADPVMIKPVFTKRMHKIVDQGRKIDAYKMFQDKYSEYSQRIATLSSFLRHDKATAELIGDDARHINLPDGSIHLCVTSPPFINAQDYFRETKLEIFWAGLATPAEIKEKLIPQQIGMDVSQIKNRESEKLKLVGKSHFENIDKAIAAVYEKDKKRAFIMYQYFTEIQQAFKETKRVLDDQGVFAITIGDSTIRQIPIATHELIADVIESVGFKTQKVNYDLIKTHALVPKRNKTAGLMEKEWAMVFTKK
jgi:DNA modification methylase